MNLVDARLGVTISSALPLILGMVFHWGDGHVLVQYFQRHERTK